LARESVNWTLKVRVNDGPQFRMAPTPTPTGPLAAPEGTTPTICVSLQLVTVAAICAPQKIHTPRIYSHKFA